MVDLPVAEQRNSKGNRRGMNPNSRGNLVPRWKPGESGNPAGSHKDPGLTPGQKAMLEEVCPFDSKGRTWRRYLEEKGLIQVSLSPKAMADFKDRIEGTVTDTRRWTGELTLRVVDDEEEDNATE